MSETEEKTLNFDESSKALIKDKSVIYGNALADASNQVAKRYLTENSSDMDRAIEIMGMTNALFDMFIGTMKANTKPEEFIPRLEEILNQIPEWADYKKAA